MADNQPTISFACPHCGLTLEAPLDMAGTQVACPAPECGKAVIVPGAAAATAAPVAQPAPREPVFDELEVVEDEDEPAEHAPAARHRKKVVVTRHRTGKTPTLASKAQGAARTAPPRKAASSSKLAATITVTALVAVVLVGGLVYAIMHAGKDHSPPRLAGGRGSSVQRGAGTSATTTTRPRTRKPGRGIEMTQEEIEAFSKRIEKSKADKEERDRRRFEEATEKAEAGDAEGQYALAECHRNGVGTDIDAAAARDLYGKAAAQEHSKALFALGMMDKKEDPEKAVRRMFDAGAAFVAEKDVESLATAIEELYMMGEFQLAQQLLPGMRGEVQPSAGTGWVGPGGYVITCYHVVSFRNSIKIESDTVPSTEVEVVKLDPKGDLAILKPKDGAIAASGLPLSLKEVSLGQQVFTVGFPHISLLGKSIKLTEGTVSALCGLNDNPRDIQISVPVQAGNSGGPLINMKGEVVGVISSKINALGMAVLQGDVMQNVNYAVKHGYVAKATDDLPELADNSIEPAEASLQELVKRVQGSIVLITAE